MPDLLAASDVLVHSTAGLTVLEALMLGCRVVSYGWGRAHVRINNEAYVREGLAEVATNRLELGAALRRSLELPRTPDPSFAALPTAGVGRAQPAAAVVAGGTWSSPPPPSSGFSAITSATAGELPSKPTPSASATTAAPSTVPPPGVSPQPSPPTSGARTTGTAIWITSTAGATRVAADFCNAVVSESTPSRTTEATSATQTIRLAQAPADASSATSLATNAAIASAAPAPAISRTTGLPAERRKEAANGARATSARSAEHDPEREHARHLLRLPRAGPGDHADRGDDDRDRKELPPPDRLAEQLHAERQEQQQAEGERRLHQRQRSVGEREDLQRPADE